MKKIILFFYLALALLISVTAVPKTHAQTTELLGGNIVNGAVTGSVLGVAAMGLRNSSDFAPLRVGLGAGLLGGVGLAIYDTTTLPQGQYFFISGTFNDGSNSSIIILLDTVYGAAGGAVIGTAAILLSNSSFTDGIQYGASLGAWAGFGFGLIDSFILAERNSDLVSSSLAGKNSLFEINRDRYNVGFLRPGLFSYPDFTGNAPSVQTDPALTLFSLRKQF